MDQGNYYQAGGSLPSDAQSYVRRPSDEELYRALKNGKFCAVLTPRQMGKSSLRVFTMKRFEKEGFACVAIDLTQIGSKDATPEQWYNSLMHHLSRGLHIRQKYVAWKTAHEDLTPVNRFVQFIEHLVLREVEKPVIIFIDEIDSVLSLGSEQFSTDDFFAAIRSFYNARADRPLFNKLNFALFGVATPNDLMKDQTRTPFNIGQMVALENFTFEQACRNLLRGFDGREISGKKLLSVIFHYTNGHPYLTQTLCAQLALKSNIRDEKEAVEEVVDDLFFNARNTNSHLLTVQERIIQNQTYRVQMLHIYQSLLHGQTVRANATDPAQIYLKLSGLVIEKEQCLDIANLIYKKHFNKEWLKRAFEQAERPFAGELQSWLDANRKSQAALQGGKLKQVLRWQEGRDDLSVLEKDFIESSAWRARRRKKILWTAVALSAIVLLVSGYFLLRSYHRKTLPAVSSAQDTLQTVQELPVITPPVATADSSVQRYSEVPGDSMALSQGEGAQKAKKEHRPFPPASPREETGRQQQAAEVAMAMPGEIPMQLAGLDSQQQSHLLDIGNRAQVKAGKLKTISVQFAVPMPDGELFDYEMTLRYVPYQAHTAPKQVLQGNYHEKVQQGKIQFSIPVDNLQQGIYILTILHGREKTVLCEHYFKLD